MTQLIALFSCGTFFGAALYISFAQHPAVLESDRSVGGRFFPPMYKRAAAMQIFLAFAGSAAGVAGWFFGMGVLWIIGAGLLFSVFPITVLFSKPVNDKLLNPENDPDSEQTQSLLRRWGPLHLLRTVVSGAAFAVYLFAVVE